MPPVHINRSLHSLKLRSKLGMDNEHGKDSHPAIEPGSKLCSHCRYMFDHWSQVLSGAYPYFLHWKDISELKASSTAGCALCTQFLLDASAERVSHAEDRLSNELIQEYLPPCGIVRIEPGSVRSKHLELDCHGWHLILTYPFTVVTPYNEAERENHAVNLSKHPRIDKIEFYVEMIPNQSNCE